MRQRATLSSPAAASPSFEGTRMQHPSAWHSPVPYLFGGLAAMLGLIAFALLILACSYWKLSGYLDDQNSDAQAAAQKSGDEEKPRVAESGWDNNVVVIMAGQMVPTFLATPSTTRSAGESQKAAVELSEAVGGGGGLAAVVSDSNRHHHQHHQPAANN